MKVIRYKCNFCGYVDTIMCSIVKTAEGSKYILSQHNDSNDLHVCPTCVEMLRETFITKNYYPAEKYV